MDTGLEALAARARRAYEWARLRRALVDVLPVVVLVALATAFTTRVVSTGLVGAVLAVTGVFSLWLGHGLQRALLPGVLAGTLPLAMVFCAARVGHACMGAACLSVCLGASALGGVGAGLVVDAWARRAHVRGTVVAVASGFGLLTGAMGTTCVGLRGVAALAGGFALALGLGWVQRGAPAQ